MYNWSVDEEAMKKADPEGYEIWRLEQMINYGLQKGEKLPEFNVRKYWSRLALDPAKKDYLASLLWPEISKSLPQSKSNF